MSALALSERLELNLLGPITGSVQAVISEPKGESKNRLSGLVVTITGESVIRSTGLGGWGFDMYGPDEVFGAKSHVVNFDVDEHGSVSCARFGQATVQLPAHLSKELIDVAVSAGIEPGMRL